jgi:hypothetical protein
MAVEMREAIRRELQNAVFESRFPVRTGRGRNIALNGARAFGSSFNSLRGHIVAPGYIKMLEEGGDILPERSEWLAIPFGYALRPDGTPKLPSPRSWQNIRKTFIYKSKKTGGLYIAYKDGDSLQVLYVLVEMVEVKGRGFLAKAWARRQSALARSFGQTMLSEISRVDLLKLSRVTYKGRGNTRQ